MQGPPATDAAASDETLMLAYGAGQAAAFDVLYARHKGGVYRYLAKLQHTFQRIRCSVLQEDADFSPVFSVGTEPTGFQIAFQAQQFG
jgi:hypothetical protein